jgi:hypothetical protein
MSSTDFAHQTPPDVSAPPVLSGGGRTAVRAALVVIATLAALVTLGSLGVLASGLSSLHVLTDTQPLPAGVRSLTIDSGDGPAIVRITTDVNATEPRVDLRMVTRLDDAQLMVTNDAAGSRVTLSDSAPGLSPWKGHVAVTVILPPGVARGLSVTVNQRTGGVATDADLDQLVTNTDDGVITLGGSARRVDVNIREGDISTSTPIAVTESFRANAKSGDISVEFRAAPRTTEAVADGDVTVGLPGPGPYRVNAESEGPDRLTTVSVPQTSDPRAPMVTAHSKGANVTVTQLR